VGIPVPRRGRIHELILQDPLSQLNAPEPILLRQSDTVAKAVQRMKKLRYGSVLVVDGAGRLTGIFTEHDLVRHFAGQEDDIERATLAEVMTRDPRALNDDDSLAHALNRMAVGGYRHIPIVRDGLPVGFVSIRGILRYIAENAL
jgi:CBS domain-containing protein